MYTAIAYCRKSTDRDDNQVNSIDYQIESVQRIAKYHKIRIEEEIIESKSAKIELTRPGFNSMMEMIKKGKCNCIIVDEPTRLSRNTIDTAYIIDLMEKGKLEAVITPSNLFRHDNFMEVEMLERYLGFGKLDNKNRSKHIKEKMHALALQGRLMYKAPPGYKNKRISKGVTSVVIDEKEKEYGMIMLQMAAEGIPFRTISDKMFSLGMKGEKNNGKVDTKFSEEGVRRFITNSFYDGFLKVNGELVKHDYPLIFPKELLEKARERIGIKKLTPVPNKDEVFMLRKILKDDTGRALTGYIRKGKYIYYKSQFSQINVSEKILVESFGQIVDKFFIPAALKSLIIEAIREYYGIILKENDKNEKTVKNKISQITNEMKSVLDLYKAGGYEEDEYTKEMQRLKIEKERVKEDLADVLDINEQAVEEGVFFIELFTNLGTVRKKLKYESKKRIMLITLIELKVDKEKRLVAQPNEVFELIQTSLGITWWTKGKKNRTANLEAFARSILTRHKLIKRINENLREVDLSI